MLKNCLDGQSKSFLLIHHSCIKIIVNFTVGVFFSFWYCLVLQNTCRTRCHPVWHILVPTLVHLHIVRLTYVVYITHARSQKVLPNILCSGLRWNLYVCWPLQAFVFFLLLTHANKISKCLVYFVRELSVYGHV